MKIPRLVSFLFILLAWVGLLRFSAAASGQSGSMPAISKTDVQATAARIRQDSYRKLAHLPPPFPQWPTMPERLQKYLDAWPTPGATATKAWPEAGPEADEDQY